MKSICALLEDWAEDFVNDNRSLSQQGSDISKGLSQAGTAISNTAKNVGAHLKQRFSHPIDSTLDTAGDVASGTVNAAGTVASGLGSAVHSLAGTAPVRNVLIAGAGLAGARYLGKKWTERQERKQSQVPNTTYKAPPKFESVMSEQNENLPRFPQLSYINKIPKSPRSVASFFMRRKPNTYSVNAGDQSVEAHRKISSRFVKRTAADTGVDRVIGKLVA